MRNKKTIETEHAKMTDFSNAPQSETRESFIDKVVSEALDNFCEEKCEHRNDDIECNGDGLGHYNLLCYRLLITELSDVKACVQAKLDEDDIKRFGRRDY